MFLLANSEDPDQTPRFVASGLGLHCLPMSQKWNTIYGFNAVLLVHSNRQTNRLCFISEWHRLGMRFFR